MNLSVSNYQVSNYNSLKAKNNLQKKVVKEPMQVTNRAQSFKGAMCFPKTKLIINPKHVVSIVVTALVATSAKIVGKFDYKKDNLLKDSKFNDWNNNWKNVPVIEDRATDITIEKEISDLYFDAGTKCEAIERGIITLSDGKKYEYEQVVNTPPHNSTRSGNAEDIKYYIPYLEAHSLSGDYTRALVDDKTYTYDCELKEV